LEGLVLTHWDEDHAGAAPDLLRDLPAGFLAFPATDPPGPGLSGRVADLCRKRGVRLVPLSRGTHITLDGLDLDLLNPPNLSPLIDGNNRCLVVRTALGGIPLMFSGDLEAPGEEEMLRSGALRLAFALVVPHHGSATSSSPPWVEAISPRIALVSVGRGNRFGHPSPDVIGRYRTGGARVARTDLDGALLLQCGARPLLFRMRDGDWSATARP